MKTGKQWIFVVIFGIIAGFSGCQNPAGDPPPPEPTAVRLLNQAAKLNGTVNRTNNATAHSIGLTNGQALLDTNNDNLDNWAGHQPGNNDDALTSRVIFVNGNGVEDHQIEAWKELISININREGMFVLTCPDYEDKFILVLDERADWGGRQGIVRRGLMDIHAENTAGRLPRTPEMAASAQMFAGMIPQNTR